MTIPNSRDQGGQTAPLLQPVPFLHNSSCNLGTLEIFRNQQSQVLVANQRRIYSKPLKKYFGFLNLDDLPFDLLSEVEYAEGGFMNERAGGGTGVEEENIFYLMICRRVGMAINNGIHFIEFSSDA